MKTTMYSLSKIAFAFVFVLAFSACESCDESVNTSALEGSLRLSPASLSLEVFRGESRRFFVTLENDQRGVTRVDTSHFDASSSLASVSFDAAGFEIDSFSEHVFAIDVEGLALGLVSGRIEFSGNATRTLPLVINIVERPICESDNPCQTSRFDEGVRACVFDDANEGQACDDESVCTSNTRCNAGQCVGERRTCDDGIACSIDTCDDLLGCTSAPLNERCDDGNACTDDTCTAGGCTNEAKEEGAVCSQEGCLLGQCFSNTCEVNVLPDGIACDDGNACTRDDVCVEGNCLGVGSLSEEPDPVIVTPEAVVYNPCFDAGNFGNNACDLGDVYTEIEELLSIRHFSTNYEFIWRGAYRDNLGNTCSPQSPSTAVPLVPDETYFCAAPIFLTHASREGQAQHQQLAMVEGVARAAFNEEQIVLANMIPSRQALRVRRISNALVVFENEYQTAYEVADLALHVSTRIHVAALPAYHQSPSPTYTITTLSVDDEGFESTDSFVEVDEEEQCSRRRIWPRYFGLEQSATGLRLGVLNRLLCEDLDGIPRFQAAKSGRVGDTLIPYRFLDDSRVMNMVMNEENTLLYRRRSVDTDGIEEAPGYYDFVSLLDNDVLLRDVSIDSAPQSYGAIFDIEGPQVALLSPYVVNFLEGDRQNGYPLIDVDLFLGNGGSVHKASATLGTLGQRAWREADAPPAISLVALSFTCTEFDGSCQNDSDCPFDEQCNLVCPDGERVDDDDGIIDEEGRVDDCIGRCEASE